LPQLEGVTKPIAENLLDSLHTWQDAFKAKLGEPFVYAADELYLKAQRALPPYEAYGDFSQIENGVGLLRMFEYELDYALEDAKKIRPRKLSLATGRSAEAFMRQMCEKLRPFGADITVYGIDNTFFGSSITVAGLVTGGDIAAQLDGKPLYDELLLPKCMLREVEDVFLDDMTPDALCARLGVPVTVVEVDGTEFVRAALLG
jgi:NifB/MoaA-like Fe-S oxidoreductase